MTSTDEIAFMPATELAKAIRRKQLSPVEIVETVLARMETLEPRLNAMAHVDAPAARAAAGAAEAAVMRGDDLQPLHGIPITLKDSTTARGMPSEQGSFIYKGAAPAQDDAVHVARLRTAGAIVLGKTTTSELGWSGMSRSPLTGVTHNPWKQGYNAGGSSGGAGAATAAGYGPLHQATDGAGSIRMPAHFCGVYGIKPTFGRVPYSPAPNIDYSSHIGPMSRTVADSALMLQVMAGPHPSDHLCLEAQPAAYVEHLKADIKGKRIAYSPDFGFARVDPEVAELVRRAAKVFADDLGAIVEEVVPPWAAVGPELSRFFWPAHFSEFAQYLDRYAERMDPALVACIRAADGMTIPDYQAHRERKLAMCAETGNWFQDWDFLLTPTASVAAFPAERLMPEHWPQHAWDWLSWAEFGYPFNFSHTPAASVPCGMTEGGLPVGMQIVGRRFDDLGVLQVSAAFEAACSWPLWREGVQI